MNSDKNLNKLLYQLYWEDGLTLRQIGAKLGFTYEGVRYYMGKAHIGRRPTGKRKAMKV